MSVVKKCFKLLQLKQHFDTGLPEREVISYLKSWNNKLKSDEFGNLFLINPGTPLLCAHMDTVQSQACVNNLHTLRLRNGTISAKDAVIGGDDKCGIAIAMEIYEKLGNKVSLLFTRQEETGANGAGAFVNNHSDLVSLCKYCLVLDRRGKGDIIGYSNQYCSKEFQDALHELIKPFGYKPEHGMLSDANKISKLINCVNLSVGYYNPHTKTEYIKCDELVNAFNTALYIVNNFECTYPKYETPKYDPNKYSAWKNSYYGTGKTLFDNDDEDDDDDYGYSYYNYYKSKKKLNLNKVFEFKNGQLIVKKNVYVTNANNDMDRSELEIGTYDVCEFA